MTLGIVPNGIKIEWNMLQNGVPIVNRMFVTQDTSPTDGDLDDTVVAATDFYNDFKTLQHSSCVLQNITVTDVSAANGRQVILPFTADNTGTGSGVAMAANAAAVASLRTVFTGRSFRGRFYLGGIAGVNQASAQTFITDLATNIGTHIMTFIDTLNTVNKTLVVVSNYASGVVRVIALATEIISVIVDNKIDSQRRRTAN